ncbi:DUF914-domain-containing protein [Rhizopogon vinicolor AM-OR11-026]|uniref:DUF914-domain-containing protein n=1 Tax=Rhizopogon vinicolor AM-OR11-026 TaxID=1314800 RepID=A0A1B7N1P9_9AGAM|nr:DUF914-domain-containing protein [Rhizopogon vinicolor AM-OR11-026]
MVLSSPKVIPSVTTHLPLSYASPWAFVESLYARFLSIWTRSFTLSLIGGQLLSMCLTCSSVMTTELVQRNWVLPSTQTFFTYLSLFIIFTPYTIHRYGIRGWGKLVFRDGWKYFLFAAADVQGNFLAVKAYGYTDLLSCMLLDAWSIPVCLFICWIYMRTRYHWTQILGVSICIGGLGILVASDVLSGRDDHAENRGKGDAFILVAATIFGIVNATEEFFVRHSPLYEVVGQIGMWGVLINGIQALSLERRDMALASWNGATIGLLAGYTASIVIVYSLAPLLFRMASSSYFNIALLTSDFYGLLFGLLHFHYTPFWSYFPAFAVVILGLVIYFCHATPEEQGEWNVQIPTYVMKTTRGGDENANADQTVTSFSDHERYERPDEFS